MAPKSNQKREENKKTMAVTMHVRALCHQILNHLLRPRPGTCRSDNRATRRAGTRNHPSENESGDPGQKQGRQVEKAGRSVAGRQVRMAEVQDEAAGRADTGQLAGQRAS